MYQSVPIDCGPVGPRSLAFHSARYKSILARAYIWRKDSRSMTEKIVFGARRARTLAMVAACLTCAWLMQGRQASAAELTANAVSNLNGYTMAYRGTNFPSGLTVQIVLSDASGSLSLGAATAGLDGSFQGITSLH